VSFTGLFDFLVHAGGYDWLNWMMDGRKGRRAHDMYDSMEKHYLSRWRNAAHRGVKAYCEKHGLRVPNRITTVQPAGTKSLLTGASSGWHAPKAQRFIRRITLGINDPLVPTLLEKGFSVIPAQSARDDEGNLLDDINDPRVQEVLVEIPTEVNWANIPGVDEFDLAQLPVEAQWGLYMNVQQAYTDHNTSATIELREEEIGTLAALIHENIENNNGYISAALLARFDVDGGTFPRLPFEPISKEVYDELSTIQQISDSGKSFLDTLNKFDREDYSLESVTACTSAACIAKADADEREKGL
jgi:ribonucleotide reductase class II